MADVVDKAHFDIHASVVFKLGEDLITDSLQALLELVKNSYDANASYVNVVVDTSTLCKSLANNTADRSTVVRAASSDPQNDDNLVNASTASQGLPKASDAPNIGFIRIEDDGVGMTIDDIRSGWLTVSNSKKRLMKERGQIAKGERTPLGDKGLGRLGTQRLARDVSIVTRPSGLGKEYEVSFSWSDFRGESTLTNVPVKFEERSTDKKQGTTLTLSGLRDIDIWKDHNQVQLELSKLISPYEGVSNFGIYAKIDGDPLDLIEVRESVRSAAHVAYKFSFDGQILTVKGKSKLSYLNTSKEDQALVSEILSDSGKKFYQYLNESKSASRYKFRYTSGESWFVEFDVERHIDDIDDLRQVKINEVKSIIANPGPFSGKADYYNFRDFISDRVFDRKKTFSEYVQDLSGIRVYRDGFGIRVDEDWLGLGKAVTGGSSWYGLRVKNTLGYVAISAEKNAVLEETTDREGFRTTPYFLNFKLIMDEFVEFANGAQAALRRNWNDYKRIEREKQAQVPEGAQPQEIVRALQKDILRSKDHSFRERESISSVVKTIDDALSNKEVPIFDQGPLRQIRKQLTDNLAVEASSEDPEIDFGRAARQLTVLIDQIGLLENQIDELYSAAGLGLTAEALTHEFQNVIDQMLARTDQLRNHLKKISSRDQRIISYEIYVRQSLSALRKQLSHLSPSLRYVREKKDDIHLRDFVEESESFYKSRLEKNSIGLEAQYDNDFHVRLNRGKLTQILDNLILNSEYWLKEEIRTGKIEQGSILITLNKPFMRVQDNGRGVHPSVEGALFEPFVTTKAKNKGRGLGLFIVSQLLDTESCSIALLSERNVYDRRYIFEIDLSGCLI